MLPPSSISSASLTARPTWQPSCGPYWTARPDAGSRPASGLRLQAGRLQRRGLALFQRRHVKAGDQVVEQPVPVDLGLQVQEDTTEADGGAVHEDEFARRGDAAELAQADRKSTRLNSSH